MYNTKRDRKCGQYTAVEVYIVKDLPGTRRSYGVHNFIYGIIYNII